MRPKLLKSFLILLLFWLGATTVYWSLQQPEINRQALADVAALFPFIGIEVPPSADILSSYRVQRDVFLYWSAPVLLAALFLAALGALIVEGLALRQARQRSHRESGSGVYRGISLTLGVLPLPARLPADVLDLGGSSNPAFTALARPYKQLLTDILGVLSAHPGAYAGEGVGVGLLEHTLNVMARALQAKRHPGLCAAVAAAHEMGKIKAWAGSVEGGWRRVKSQDREAALALVQLPSWYALPEAERTAVLLAVKYHDNPRNIPDLEGDVGVYRLARDLLSAAEGVQAEAVKEEKQKVLEKAELPDAIFQAFIKSLPLLPFQNRGLPKGVQAVAWKIGSRVYMLEIKLRETVSAKLAPEIKAALTPTGKERSRLQPFTLELLKALDQRGWLVKRVEGARVEAKDALWNVKAGKLDFRGVIIVDVPADYIAQLPADDSMYEVSVVGPLFAGAAQMSVSRDDLLGNVLRAKPAAADSGEG
jgi:hypothetical protein